MDVPIESEIDAAAQAGFTSLDLWAPKLDAYLATYPVVLLDARLREHNLHVLALSGTEAAFYYSKPEWVMAQARFLDTCTRLDAVGGGLIVVSPGSISGPRDSQTDITEGATRTLQDLSDLAAPFEVRIAFEFCVGRHSSVRSLAHSQEIVRRVARRNVGLALSTLQFSLSEGKLEEIDELEITSLWLVHLGDAERLPGEGSPEGIRTIIGQGVVPLRRICAKLTAKGFRGPYSVEMPNWQRPLPEIALSSRQAAMEILTYLDSRET